MALSLIGWSKFKKELHELYKANELGNKDPYTLSHPGLTNPKLYPESGYSFGYCQGDIANSEEWQRKFEELIRNKENGLSAEEANNIIEKSKYEGDPAALKEHEEKINEILRNASDEIDARYDDYLNEVMERVAGLIEKAKPEYQEFLNKDEVKKFLCDYDNQFRISPVGPMKKYLTIGATTIGLAEDATRYHLKIEGDIGWRHLLDLYFHTSQAQRTPADPARRFSNLVEQTGLDLSDLTAADKAYIFELKNLLGEELFGEIYSNPDNDGFRRLFQWIFADAGMREATPILATIAGLFETAHGSSWARRDPIVLDLDGNGIQPIPLAESEAYFDLDGDGFRERTEWVSGEDGFLALDADENGIVDHIGELFGDEDPAFEDGFGKLETYDFNGDGRIDAADEIFPALKIWQDADQDGFSDPGEIKALTDAGIRSIRLGAVDGLSSFQFESGLQGEAGDRFFSVDQANSFCAGEAGEPLGNVDPYLDSENILIPWARGYGNVKDLALAAKDEPDLMQFVSELDASGEIVQFYNQIDELLARWAGVADVPKDDLRGAISARRLAVLERFMGRNFTMQINGAESYNAMGKAADWLEEAYERLKSHVFSTMAVQTSFADVFSGTSYDFLTDRIVLPVDSSEAAGYLSEIANHASLEEKIFIGHVITGSETDTGVVIGDLMPLLDEETQFVFENLDRMLLGTEGPDHLNAGSGDDAMVGFSGTDSLFGGRGDDVLYGGKGDDNLEPGDGNDRTQTGPGNDVVSDSNGDDLYLFHAGDGDDLIYDRGTERGALSQGNLRNGGSDTIRFDGSIGSEDVRFMLEGTDLVLTFETLFSDRLVLVDWNKRHGYHSEYWTRIEKLEFADGTFFDAGAMLSRLGTDGDDTILIQDAPISLIDTGAGADDVKTGKFDDFVNTGEGNDRIFSGDGSDHVKGGAGDDTLAAGDGADTVEGGKGSDSISDSNGNDLYLFNAGDGRDVIYDRGTERSSLNDGLMKDGGKDAIRLGEDIDEKDVRFMLDGDDLLLTFESDPSDRITVTDWNRKHGYHLEPWTRIETIEFADGTVFDEQDVLSRLGTSGDDTIFIDDLGVTLLDTGAGNDLIGTGDFDDLVNAGADNDRISTQDGDDTLIGGLGIDWLEGGSGNDTYLFDGGHGQDTIYDCGPQSNGFISDGGIDTLCFGKDIRPGDVFFTLEGADLYTHFHGRPKDHLTLKDWAKSYGYSSERFSKIEHVRFSCGTVLPIGEIARWHVGTEDGDLLAGGGDTDYINGGSGDDILDGGVGNDMLVGSGGNDIYRFGPGFGQDTVLNDDDTANRLDMIEFTQEIDPGDVTPARIQNDLVLELASTGDCVTVKNHFRQGDLHHFAIDKVKFAKNGSVWTKEAIDRGSMLFSEVHDYELTLAEDTAISGSIQLPDGHGPFSCTVLQDAIHGAFSMDTAGCWVYRPEKDFWGEDGATVSIANGLGEVAVSTLSFSVTSANDAPRAADDVYLTDEDIPLTVSAPGVLANDSDIDGDPVSTVPAIIRGSAHGTLDLRADGSFNYVPAADYSGSETFSYMAVDADGISSSGIVEISVAPVNDAPSVPITSEHAVFGGVEVAGKIRASDPEGDSLSFKTVEKPRHGSFELDRKGGWVYTPEENFSGMDGATVAVTDGCGGVSETHVSLKVNVYEGGKQTVKQDGPEKIIMAGIRKADIDLIRCKDDLVIPVRVGGKLRLSDYFTGRKSGVKQLRLLEGPIYLDKFRISEVRSAHSGRKWRFQTGSKGVKNLIYGSSKDEVLIGANKDDVLFGIGGDDELIGDPGHDTLLGGRGKDRLEGGRGNDTLWGDNHKDKLYGDQGRDTLIGGTGNDVLYGGSGSDHLYGSQGHDKIFGSGGGDVLAGGGGNDVLIGEKGGDIYTFDPGGGSDRILEYKKGEARKAGASGKDVVRFGAGIDCGDVAIFRRANRLFLQYGEKDTIEIEKQTNSKYKIERFELADGSYLTDADIDNIVQQIALCAETEGISTETVKDVRNNEKLMALIAASWINP